MTYKKYLTVFAVVAVMFVAAFAAQKAYTTDEPSPEQLAALKKLYVRPTTIPFASDNPYSDAKYALGKVLFFDPRLSDSKVMSCGTCHNPGLNWTDGLAHGVGNFHQQLGRKTMSLLNIAWDDAYFWDGRADSLEQQAPMVFEIPKVMNMTFENILARINAIPGYRPLFDAAFPGEQNPITRDNIGKAIAIFERKIVSGTAPFDKWVVGDDNAISVDAKRGFVLYNKKAGCVSCHSGWNFSDGSFHDTGLNDADIGRGKFLPDIALMQHAFKTPGLRNIAGHAPYMHDGSLNTLTDVINFYNDGFVKRPSLATEMKPLNLTDQEKRDLISFLSTLSSVDDPVTLPQLPQ